MEYNVHIPNIVKDFFWISDALLEKAISQAKKKLKFEHAWTLPSQFADYSFNRWTFQPPNTTFS